jgi:hypothetical protein
LAFLYLKKAPNYNKVAGADVDGMCKHECQKGEWLSLKATVEVQCETNNQLMLFVFGITKTKQIDIERGITFTCKA